jgi:hypothetical protein
MNVDDLLPEAWHPAHVAALDAWQLGDVVPTPRLFWAALDGLDPVTRLESHTGASAWQVIAPKIPAPTPESLHWGVITTPTCNVSACGPGARCATVQISPVVPLHEPDFTPSQIIAVTKHEMVDFVLLTNPPAPGEWAIDLRISLPTSKGVLLGHTPRRGFACESDEIEFADHLAGRSRSPALHDELSGSMLKSLRALVKKQRGPVVDDVEQVRLLVCEGSRLAPTKVQLIVVEETRLTAEDRTIWRKWRETERKRLTRLGILLLPLLFRTVDELNVDIYRRAVPLNVPELKRGFYV